MIYKVHPKNPEKRIIEKIAKDIVNGKVFILPTDTVYAFATTLSNKKAIEKLYSLKDMPDQKPLSLYCKDFSQVSEYVRMDNNQIFRWMKANLPGPFTLIFKASKKLPQYTLSKQKTVGIRVIDHPVTQMLLSFMDMPIIGTSVFTEEKYISFPEELEKKYGKLVAGIVDAGPIELSLSTVLNAEEYPFEIIRQGKGEIES
ncbi:MAG: L-threonylcarbamoyladenylate synthase [Spirochaetia bacterium]|nr:L-threonylcarbamoyladenylate synthase [Spirochaetia bacterium]